MITANILLASSPLDILASYQPIIAARFLSLNKMHNTGDGGQT
tara:strand:- start:358 stop:486 length:129 start_codon:yes stop_codon:yes gene_type:complete